MSKTKIIEPECDEDPKALLEASIRRIAPLENDADWLAPAFIEDTEFKAIFDRKRVEKEPDAYQVWVEETLGILAAKYPSSRDAVLSASFIEILQEYFRLKLRGVISDRGGWSLKPFLDETDLSLPEALPHFAESFLAREDIDWNAGLAQATSDKPVREVDVVLYLCGRIQADSFVKPDFYLHPKLVHPDDFNDRASPCYWIMLQAASHWLNPTLEPGVTVPSVLAQMFPMFQAADDGEKVKIALGLLTALNRCWGKFGIKGKDLDKDLYEIVATDLLAYFRELDPLLSKHPSDPKTLQAWLSVGYHVFSPAFGNLSSEEHEPSRKKLLTGALSCLGLLRGLTKIASNPDAASMFDRDFDFAAFACANSLGSRWEVLKPLLLAFASLNTAAVAKDLRYWPEKPKDDPPYPWREIPTWIATAMQPGTVMDIEREQDPTLLQLRTEFAKFCLSRIKTRKPPKGQVGPLTNEDFIEPRPIWRQCYVRAARDLKVNPQGMGHHILFWSSSNDPDPEVREQAKIAYKDLRHGPALEAEHGPRRPLYGAFWWLRQAHLLGLGIEPDAQGARRTREKEVRRASGNP
ncbi:MAG: hypothetical protein HY897_23860 [Deltaproteobacteria bacterium]|nr:hypothetical protein [Deltaproteobacteria bacterium]